MRANWQRRTEPEQELVVAAVEAEVAEELPWLVEDEEQVVAVVAAEVEEVLRPLEVVAAEAEAADGPFD